MRQWLAGLYATRINPEEGENVVVARKHDSELALVFGVWSIDQIWRKTFAIDTMDGFLWIEELHEVSVEVSRRVHGHLPIVEVMPHYEHGAVFEFHTNDRQAYGLRHVVGDHGQVILKSQILLVRLGDETSDPVLNEIDLLGVSRRVVKFFVWYIGLSPVFE